jgi:hypothetical protein
LDCNHAMYRCHPNQSICSLSVNSPTRTVATQVTHSTVTNSQAICFGNT